MSRSASEAAGVDPTDTVYGSARDEDAAEGERIPRRRQHAADSVRDEEASADAAAASAALQSDEPQDSGDSHGDGESDSDCGSESSYLEAMTSSGQQHYLRLGHTPRRRSALRLSRIIARRQLLWKLSQGRDGG